jgi:predicted DCC family thiol-disulfide oxidoreductase YuxK
MLKRGFWLYVWRVETPQGEMLYVGRTGDNSSPHATAPYTRMGQHLGSIKTQNALRQHLRKKGLQPEDCTSFHLVSHGPIYPEVEHAPGLNRAELMAKHLPLRDMVGAMEKALAEELKQAGYQVLNSVRWKHPHDPAIWETVRAAFAEHFPKLAGRNALDDLDKPQVVK